MDKEDIFHDVVMGEERGQKEGYKQGLEIGRNQGMAEGQRLGWEKGAEIGSEVGFYAGFAESLLEEMRKDGTVKPRAIKSLERMVAIGAEYPLTEPQNQDLQQKLEELRTKFKQVCSLCGIKQETTKLSGVKGLSF